MDFDRLVGEADAAFVTRVMHAKAAHSQEGHAALVHLREGATRGDDVTIAELQAALEKAESTFRARQSGRQPCHAEHSDGLRYVAGACAFYSRLATLPCPLAAHSSLTEVAWRGSTRSCCAKIERAWIRGKRTLGGTAPARERAIFPLSPFFVLQGTPTTRSSSTGRPTRSPRSMSLPCAALRSRGSKCRTRAGPSSPTVSCCAPYE
jgi:hypothetical protein